MTPLSRPLAPSPAGAPREAARRPIFRAWHAACCSLLASGCFYLGPMPTLEENVAPVAFRYTVEPNTPIGIGSAGKTVLVLAEDADGDPILFTWWLSEDGYIGDAVPVPYDVGGGAGSQVRFAYDPHLDGQTLRCELDDGINEPLGLEWPLEVYP